MAENDIIDRLTESLIDLVVNATATERGVHAETAIAGCGWLAGQLLQGASPKGHGGAGNGGDPWVSEKLAEWAAISYESLGKAGITLAETAEITDENDPLIAPATVAARLKNEAEQMFADAGIDGEERFWTAALATSRLVIMASQVLEARLGAIIGMNAIRAGATAGSVIPLKPRPGAGLH